MGQLKRPAWTSRALAQLGMLRPRRGGLQENLRPPCVGGALPYGAAAGSNPLRRGTVVSGP